MKTFVTASVLALLMVRPVAVQQRFTSTTTLLTIDATVTDANGAPVSGLTAADFEVKLNGKTQPGRAVAFLQASNAIATVAVERPVSASARRAAGICAAPRRSLDPRG